jgi:hypothetical protein
LTTALRQRTERWGIAVAGGYWKPVLRVKVRPGGEGRFEELQKALENSGIEVQKKQESRRPRFGGTSVPT